MTCLWQLIKVAKSARTPQSSTSFHVPPSELIDRALSQLSHMQLCQGLLVIAAVPISICFSLHHTSAMMSAAMGAFNDGRPAAQNACWQSGKTLPMN